MLVGLLAATPVTAQTSPSNLQAAINSIPWSSITGQVKGTDVQSLFNSTVQVFETWGAPLNSPNFTGIGSIPNGWALGTPSQINLQNASNIPISALTPLGNNVAAALAVNIGTAGAVVVNGGVLGTPSSGVLTNATGLPISTGVFGLGTGVATLLAGAASGSSGPVGTVAPTIQGLTLAGTPLSATFIPGNVTANIWENGPVTALSATRPEVVGQFGITSSLGVGAHATAYKIGLTAWCYSTAGSADCYAVNTVTQGYGGPGGVDVFGIEEDINNLNANPSVLWSGTVENDVYGNIAVNGGTLIGSAAYDVKAVFAGWLYGFGCNGSISAQSRVATLLVAGVQYTILTVGSTDFTLIGAASNTVGIVFTASGPGTGTGTATVDTVQNSCFRDESNSTNVMSATGLYVNGIDFTGGLFGTSYFASANFNVLSNGVVKGLAFYDNATAQPVVLLSGGAGGYGVMYDGSASIAYQAGGTSDPTDYIRNTTIKLQSRAGSTTFAQFSSAGFSLLTGVLGIPQATWTDTQTCSVGQISVDANYVYACTSTNVVKRAALSTF